MVVVESEARAREVAEYRARKRREHRQANNSRQTLDQLLKTRETGEKQSAAAGARNPTCRVRPKRSRARWPSSAPTKSAVQILQSGVGGITESDVILAHASAAPA